MQVIVGGGVLPCDSENAKTNNYAAIDNSSQDLETQLCGLRENKLRRLHLMKDGDSLCPEDFEMWPAQRSHVAYMQHLSTYWTSQSRNIEKSPPPKSGKESFWKKERGDKFHLKQKGIHPKTTGVGLALHNITGKHWEVDAAAYNSAQPH